MLGSIEQKLGLYDDAAARVQRALELERQLHGPKHASVAARLHDLGGIEVDRSRLDEAELFITASIGIAIGGVVAPDDAAASSARASASRCTWISPEPIATSSCSPAVALPMPRRSAAACWNS